jgi:stage II sporulation protein AB (anti-sigma F factor)
MRGISMSETNEITLEFDSRSQNESFARMVVAAFVSSLDPTIEEIADIKTAVSEAVTNCIIHAYENKEGKIILKCKLESNKIFIEISDKGKGIVNIEQAMEPLYTSKPELERSGMGFAFMEAFMDKLEVLSTPGVGTTILMEKEIKSAASKS